MSAEVLSAELTEIGLGRIRDSRNYRQPQAPYETENTSFFARSISMIHDMELEYPHRLLLGFVVLLHERGNTFPLLWAADKVQNEATHIAIGADLVSRLPQEHQNCTIWPSRIYRAMGNRAIFRIMRDRDDMVWRLSSDTKPIDMRTLEAAEYLQIMKQDNPDLVFTYQGQIL